MSETNWINYAKKRIAEQGEVSAKEARAMNEPFKDGFLDSFESQKAKIEKEINRRENRDSARLKMFEKYIHTNNCSDEGGWFAFFTRGEVDDLPEWRVNGCETEEEAVSKLCTLVIDSFYEKGWVD